MIKEEIFTGQDLSEAFNKGAEATLNALIEDCKELMAYDDGYEAMKMLDYYIEKYYSENIDLKKKIENAMENYYKL